MEKRSEVDSGAGVADRDSVGRDQSEVCGERRADGPLDAQSRLGPQGAGREGAEKLRAGVYRNELRNWRERWGGRPLV